MVDFVLLSKKCERIIVRMAWSGPGPDYDPVIPDFEARVRSADYPILDDVDAAIMSGGYSEESALNSSKILATITRRLQSELKALKSRNLGYDAGDRAVMHDNVEVLISVIKWLKNMSKDEWSEFYKKAHGKEK